jgi:hypothetical protein
VEPPESVTVEDWSIRRGDPKEVFPIRQAAGRWEIGVIEAIGTIVASIPRHARKESRQTNREPRERQSAPDSGRAVQDLVEA